ncbi:MAG: hypothetical protein ACFHWZ_19240 [Phycisphaerales bacterium]
MTTTRSIRWLLLSLLTAFALLWSPAMAIAQDGSPSEPETTQEGSGDDADEGASGSIDLASPRSAISSFMRAMRAHTGLEPEPRALERALGAVEIPSDVLREADDSEVAFRLYEVLRYFESFAPGEDLASIAPSRNNLPSDGVWTSTLTDADGDTTLLLELEARDGDWRISEGTTRIAYALYDSLELDLVQSTLRRWGLEWAVSGRLFGLRYYQWAGLFVLILLGLCFDLALRGVVQVISRRYLKKSEDDKTEHDTGELIRRVARPPVWRAARRWCTCCSRFCRCR